MQFAINKFTVCVALVGLDCASLSLWSMVVLGSPMLQRNLAIQGNVINDLPWRQNGSFQGQRHCHRFHCENMTDVIWKSLYLSEAHSVKSLT